MLTCGFGHVPHEREPPSRVSRSPPLPHRPTDELFYELTFVLFMYVLYARMSYIRRPRPIRTIFRESRVGMGGETVVKRCVGGWEHEVVVCGVRDDVFSIRTFWVITLIREEVSPIAPQTLSRAPCATMCDNVCDVCNVCNG